MKIFEAPEMEIVRFEVSDIITQSNELPITPFSARMEDELVITNIGKP